MRDDLLDAYAAVYWANSQLQPFHQRISAWLNDKVDIRVEDLPPPATHNPVVVSIKEAFPFSFNVEFGAYLNTIRSSLDILATALAERYGVPNPDNAYFPVARDGDAFERGDFKGSKFVKSLPEPVRAILKALKPYKGGNDRLWSLHHLDIVRKHRRLIRVDMRPITMSLASVSIPADRYVPLPHRRIGPNEQAIMGLLKKGAAYSDMKFSSYVSVDEATMPERSPVLAILSDFAGLAETIIKLFDDT